MIIDTYFTLKDEAEIRGLCAGFENVLGPAQGRSVMTETVDPEGNIVPLQPAVGDPVMWYACIRAEDKISLPPGCLTITAEEGSQVLGCWA